MNPLFNQNQPQLPFQNFQRALTEFANFRKSFQGNPQQIVMNMITNGQMSKEQFNQLKAMAEQFKKMMH